MGYYVVRGNDHLASIAHRHGVTPEAIWGHDANAKIKRDRGDGTTLRAGDVVFVPEPPKRDKVTIAAGATKTFHATVARVPLKVRLSHEGKPIAGEAYRVLAPGEVLTGTTDGDGLVDVKVRAFVSRVEILLEKRRERYSVEVGGLDPKDDISGVQKRLRNLGFYLGTITGALDASTQEAIKRFQTAHGLEASGELDEATRKELSSMHGA
jgi:hypothetical protein